MKMRSYLTRLGGLALLGMVVMLAKAQPAHAYTNSRLMDNQVFDKVGTMNETDIQNFLASKGPCLVNYNDVDPNWNGSSWTYTGSVRASHIIYKVAQQWGMNPQVLLATLQKEESLITGTSCDSWRYNSAMGYGCPDSGGCNAKYAGFTRQVLWGGWQLAFNRHRSEGDTSWDGDGDITYSGYMTRGTYKRCNTCASTFYDGTATIDGQSIFLENGTTASLYTYTPHLGQSFPGIFEGWFGSTLAYDYQFISASNPPAVMMPGQTVTVGVVLRNTGGLTWWDETNGAQPANEDSAGGGLATPMRLYTAQPPDHNNPFGGGSGWVGQNRMTMLSGKTAYGDPGTFQFSYTAPTTPGTYREHFAPTIENVTKLKDVGMEFNVTVPKVYDYQFVSATNPPSVMTPGQTISLSVTLQNKGNTTWYNESNASGTNADPAGLGSPTPVRLFTSQPQDHTNPFAGGSGWVDGKRMTMQTASVAPGQNGTFIFNYTAPSGAGSYHEHFAVTMENVVKMRDVGMEFDVTVPPQYGYQFVSAVNPPSSMSRGQTLTVSVTLRNTGYTVWKNEANDASTPFRLFTAQPIDHVNPFSGGAGWVDGRRMTMQTATAGYGETATFSFSYTAPQTPGTYREHFAPTQENVIKLADIGMEFDVSVQ